MIANADPRAVCAPYAGEIHEAVRRVLDSGSYILGPEGEAFEREWAAWLGAAAAVGVANGTDAIELALRAVGVVPGDGVVVPANTVSATAAAVVATGARPVFCDVDPATMNLDPQRLAALLTGPAGRGITAVVPVHLYGHPADLPALLEVARRHGLRVVEDCAQAHGAAIDGRGVGTWGDAAAFSFYPTKNLGALGDGGAVVTRDPTVANRVRELRQYGWRTRYVSDGDGGRNSRLDEVQAAVLRVQLRHLEAGNDARRRHAAEYARLLAGAPLRLPPAAGLGIKPVFHQFAIRTPRRGELQAWLRERGVGAAVLYPVPLHRQPAFARWAPLDSTDLAESERACAEVLSLPVHPGLSPADITTVAGHVLDWCRAAGLAS